MKKTAAVFIICLLSIQGYSQFPFHTIMPMNAGRVMFADTLQNTPDILKKEGIRKIITLETSTKRRKGASFTTTYLVNDGEIISRYWCLRPSPDTAFRFCHADTLLYNNDGQLQEYRATAGKGEIYLRLLLDYRRGGEVVHTWIAKDPRKAMADTTCYHLFFNEKRQLVRRADDPGTINPNNAELFYNKDGLPDSIRHENPAWGTYVFQRDPKGKNTVLTLERINGIDKWVYNSAGQCIASESSFKFPVRMPDGNLVKNLTKVQYSYNKDGTLSKVVEKRKEEKLTIVYSYEK
jgi:hypothetical protein